MQVEKVIWLFFIMPAIAYGIQGIECYGFSAFPLPRPLFKFSDIRF